MESLAQFVKALCFMDKLFFVDIESAYHHIEIAPRHRTLLGFRFECVTYVYNALPFGLTTSANVFCMFTAVTAQAVRTSGLASALIVYVDDFGGSVGQHRDQNRMDGILHIIRSFGWVLPHRNSTSICRAPSSYSGSCSTRRPRQLAFLTGGATSSERRRSEAQAPPCQSARARSVPVDWPCHEHATGVRSSLPPAK
jgi:hypothetical protein